MSENYFADLYAINVADKLDKKGGLSYLSWAWAWAELKKVHPDAFYTVYENKDGWNYHTDGNTAWVKTGVTVNGLEHIEYLPIMNYQNKSIALASVSSYDVNKAIQRSLTKAIGRHGLGLSIYAGEDLPEGDTAPATGKKAAEGKPAANITTLKQTLIDFVNLEPPVLNAAWIDYANKAMANNSVEAMQKAIAEAQKNKGGQ
jgi:hypothetical protein